MNSEQIKKQIEEVEAIAEKDRSATVETQLLAQGVKALWVIAGLLARPKAGSATSEFR